MDALSKDKAPPGMIPLEWCHTQAWDPIITQIIGEIDNKTIGKMKIKMGMPSELKAFIRNREAISIETRGSIQESKGQCKNQEPNSYTSGLQTKSHRRGCHDQVGHLG